MNSNEEWLNCATEAAALNAKALALADYSHPLDWSELLPAAIFDLLEEDLLERFETLLEQKVIGFGFATKE